MLHGECRIQDFKSKIENFVGEYPTILNTQSGIRESVACVPVRSCGGGIESRSKGSTVRGDRYVRPGRQAPAARGGEPGARRPRRPVAGRGGAARAGAGPAPGDAVAAVHQRQGGRRHVEPGAEPGDRAGGAGAGCPGGRRRHRPGEPGPAVRAGAAIRPGRRAGGPVRTGRGGDDRPGRDPDRARCARDPDRRGDAGRRGGAAGGRAGRAGVGVGLRAGGRRLGPGPGRDQAGGGGRLRR